MAQEQAQTLALLPNPPATDVMGNVTPAGMTSQALTPGADILARPEVPISDSAEVPFRPGLPLRPSGGASIGAMLDAKGISRPIVSPFVSNQAQGAETATRALGSAAAAPGGWARAVLAGTMHALSGGLSSLGDVGAVGTVPPGGGALTGAARTMAARGERQMKEREELSKEKTQDALRAETMQRVVSNQRNTYRQDQESRTATYGQNAKFIDSLRANHETQDNVTQSQLTDMIKKDPNFWKEYTGRAVGEEPVFDANGKPTVDKGGNPVMSPLYSVSKIIAKDGQEGKYVTTDKDSAYFKKYAGDSIPTGTTLTLDQYNNLHARASSVENTSRAIEKANDEDMSEEQHRQLITEMQDMNIQHYISMVPGEPLGGLYQAQKNAQDHIATIDKMIAAQPPQAAGQAPNPTIATLQQQRQQFVDQGQKIDHVITFGFNDKAKADYQKDLEEQRKQTEVERHARVEEANKAAELKVKQGGFAGDPNAATPEAYLQSLDPEARSTVKMIGEGRAPLNNPAYLLARKPEIMDAVAKAYPDFDASKIKSYQDTYKDYTSGKTSIALNSGGTALGHLRELQALNTSASHILGTPAHNAYINKADTVASELAKFYGDATVPAIAAIKDTLTATLPGNREAAIRTQAQSMGDKLDSFETEWTNAAPSKAYQAPMPGISLQAKQARAALDPTYAQQHPELGVRSTKAGPSIALPAGITPGSIQMVVPGGKPHWISPENQQKAKDAGAVQVGR